MTVGYLGKTSSATIPSGVAVGDGLLHVIKGLRLHHLGTPTYAVPSGWTTAAVRGVARLVVFKGTPSSNQASLMPFFM